MTLPPRIGVLSSSGEEGSPSGLALLPDPRARTGTPQLSAMALPFFRHVITFHNEGFA
ncbi:hypothetical protein DPMN_129388 [Dreissena polymorpha]|uniref:Uncharacterized protein n=1 Tax=Dreissena polymorpha TaxID=45954 RepID=A0A9D4JXB0_DREPO|nr:hypothetical protein DPMN_129388 [Dreissena polymorpha]